MAGKSLRELLGELTHVGELSRLLSAFPELKASECSRRELLEFVNRTAGADHRSPDPEPAMAISLHLGLLRKKGDVFQLTEVAQSFLANRQRKVLDLGPAQGKILLGLFLDDSEIQDRIASLLRTFARNKSGRLLARTDAIAANKSLADTLNLLQQIRVIEYVGDVFLLNPEFESIFPDQATTLVELTEDALWQRLEEQRARARRIEELVLEQERSRLRSLGKGDLAEAVIRVSALNAGIGYDISSFDSDENPRFIEVKSSTGNQIRFKWSENERIQAKRFGPQYWIYFVPMSQALPPQYCPVLMIRNPMARLTSGYLEENPTEYLVQGQKKAIIGKIARFSRDSSMLEWTPQRV